MRKIFYIISMLAVGYGQLVCADDKYIISFENNGFFNYNHKSGVVIFQEDALWRDSITKRFMSSEIVYEVNLKTQTVLKKTNINNKNNCMGSIPKLSPDGSWLSSVSFKLKKIFLLNRVSGQCSTKRIDFNVVNYAWSRNSKWMLFYDRSFKSFYRFSPIDLRLERYTHDEHASFFTWEPHLKTTIFAFTPKKYLDRDDIEYTSDDLDYFYIDKEDGWKKYNKSHPLYSDTNNIYFYHYSNIGMSPSTVFYDALTNKKISEINDYAISYNKTNVIMLADNWLYIQGGRGLFNYRLNKFSSFPYSDIPVVPFAVDKNRYAIMYDRKQGVLKTYDFKGKKYINTYLPFWRK